MYFELVTNIPCIGFSKQLKKYNDQLPHSAHASAAPIIVEHRAENILASTSGGVLEFIRRPSLKTNPQAFIYPTCIKSVSISSVLVI